MTLYIRNRPTAVWPKLPASQEHERLWLGFLELERVARSSRSEIALSQIEQLREVIGHCWSHVEFYRKKWVEWGLEEGQLPRSMQEFWQWPRLTRRELAENMDGLTANRLPGGDMLLTTLYTAGSTGEPVGVRQTARTKFWWEAMFLRSFHWARFDHRHRFAAIRYYAQARDELRQGVKLDQLDPAFSGLLEPGEFHVMDIHVDPALQLEWLLKVRPVYLISYPSNLEALAYLNLGLSREARLELGGVLSMCETVTGEMQALMRESFHAPVVNVYSSQEVGYIASPCPYGLMHVFEDNVVLEIVDDKDERCPLHEEGNVVLTTLHNFAMPLVRYDIGDRASWELDCPCTRGLRCIGVPRGKRVPLFTLPTKTAIAVRKSSMDLAVALRKLPWIRQFRVTQKSVDAVVVDVVPAAEWDDRFRHEVEREVHSFFESDEVRVQLVLHESRIPLTKAGKSPHLVTEVPNI